MANHPNRRKRWPTVRYGEELKRVFPVPSVNRQAWMLYTADHVCLIGHVVSHHAPATPVKLHHGLAPSHPAWRSAEFVPL